MKVVLMTHRFHDGEAAAEYAKAVSARLVEDGHDPAIVSFRDGDYSVPEEVDVHRVELSFEGDNFFNWSMMLNNELKRAAREAFDEEPDIIHVVDWTTIPGGVTLSRHYESPLVVTFQSTENERGFAGEHAGMISELEWQGSFEADKVLATSEDTKNSLLFDLDVPEHKIELLDPYSDAWTDRVLKIYESLVKDRKEVKKT
ncbi:MAG: glycosyltransferase family 4 protein [Candidatus Nanohaloarchaea archaeon]